MIENLISESKKIIPDLEIKYKNESAFMKIIGKILFFNKDFMNHYITTIGSIIYFPSKSFLEENSTSSSIILLHEICHVYDSKKITKPLFSFLYLFPQILFLLFFPALFISWKLAILFLIFIAPFPAYFRMLFEKRAYMVSLYTAYKLGKKMNFNYDLDHHKQYYLKQFNGSSYYFMWMFSGLNKDFDKAIQKIKNNEHPFESNLFLTIDHLIETIPYIVI